MKATPSQQQDLLVVADTDEEIRRLEHKRGNLPEQQVLDEHIEIREKVAVELLEATEREERLQAHATSHEREIATTDEGRKHAESLIYSGQITNDRELEARRKEVDDAHQKKNEIEDSLLEIMEQMEEVSSLTEELSTRRDELTAQVSDLTTRRDEAAKDIDAELAALRERREAEAAAVPDELVAAYERARGNRKGRIVARLEGKTCTSCMLELTAIELEDIKETAKDSLATCEQCGAFLVPT